MPNKHATGAHSTVIRCPNCGEDYSITYKRCPFCDEKTVPPSRRRRDEDEYEEPDLFDEEGEDEDVPSNRGGGKRLAGGGKKRRGGGYTSGGWTPLRVAGTVVSLAVIAAAAWIVVTQIMPLVTNEKPDPTPVVTPTAQVTPSAEPTPVVTDPAVLPTGDPEVTATPDPSTMIPSTQTATGFSLNKSDITINNQYPEPVRLKVTFTPAGSTGEITWSSSNSEVVTVDSTGLVSAGSKTGSATITATMAGGVKKECTVRNSVTKGGGGENTPVSAAPSGSLSLNHTDFSFSSMSDASVQMRVSGTSSTPVWSIGDSSVATISESGVVKPAGSGTTNITCTVDGQTLKCIVRCQF